MKSRSPEFTTTIRATAIALAIGFGIAASGPVSAQVSTPTQQGAVETPAPIEAVPVEEEDDGFDWGWLGLLGLAGLAGLARRGGTETRRVERTTTDRRV